VGWWRWVPRAASCGRSEGSQAMHDQTLREFWLGMQG
jgi:hypothetical protein